MAIIVRRPTRRIAQHCVRLVERDHFFLGEVLEIFVEVGDTVGMAGAYALTKGAANLVVSGASRNAEDVVVVGFGGHGQLPFAE